MTICNMTIEGGGRAGMIAPDDTTFEWLQGRPGAPRGAELRAAVAGVARAAHRRGRELRPRDRPSTAARCRRCVTWGTNPGQVVGGHRRGAGARRRSTPGRPRGRRARAALHGPRAGHARSRRSGSTGCSSGRARTRASATCAPPPRSCAGRRVADRVSAMVVPGSVQVKEQAEAEGLDEVFRAAGFDWRGRRLLDVPRHEPRHPRRPASAAPRPRTATSRVARAAAGAPISSRRRWPPPRPSRAASSTSATGARERTDGADRNHRRSRQRARARERRHRPDHPQAVPQAGGAHRLRGVPVLRLGAGARLGPAAQPDPRRRARTSAAAPRASTPPWALDDYGFRAVIAPSFGDIFYSNSTKIGLLPVVPSTRPTCTRSRRPARPRSTSRRRRCASTGAARRFEIDPDIKHRLLNGLDDIALTLKQDEAIGLYEHERERVGPVTTALAT